MEFLYGRGSVAPGGRGDGENFAWRGLAIDLHAGRWLASFPGLLCQHLVYDVLRFDDFVGGLCY
jgi:hypothetical protein